MMTTHRSRSGVVAALAAGAMLLSLAPAPGQADDESARTPPEEKTRPAEPEPRYEPPAEEPSPPKPSVGVLYVPPGVGFPGRRIGAGTRGMGRLASIQILAPDHLGYTTEEQPTLYWYLAEPTTLRIDFTIRDETSVEPVLEVQLPPPAQAGVQAVRLADHGVRLRAGTHYHWFVSLVPDAGRRSKDFTVGAWIARREPDAALRGKLASADGREAFVYAESGLWYDAIRTLSSRIAASPRDSALREQRAALLEQAGLSEVAAYDRGAASLR
jgi:hypothetical protein